MTSNIENITEVIAEMLSQFDNVGIRSPKHNTRPHTGTFVALALKLKSKLSQLFI